MTQLYCSDNQLTILNVQNGNNSNMSDFDFNAAGNPDLGCIQVDSETYATATWNNIDPTASFGEACYGPAIVNIPDPNFKAGLVGNANINTNGDVEIQVAEAEAFSGALFIGGSQIADLTGIASFVAMTFLLCDNNQLTSLDLSTNSALTNLDCSSNQLTSLDLSANLALTTLSCRYNQLTSLDLSVNSALTELSCDNNQLSSLNVQNGNNSNMGNLDFYATGNPELSCIQVDSEAYGTATWNNIDATSSFSEDCSAPPNVYIPDPIFKAVLVNNSYINTNGDTEIQVTEAEIYNGVLNISFSPISDLTGIASFIAVTELICYNNQLTSLDLSNNSALTILHCYNNQLTSLDLSANSALTELYCNNNQLTSLDLSANSALIEFTCENSQLTSLDLSANTALTFLSFAGNQLTSLDLSANTALTVIFCENNQLTGLDLSANSALTTLYCDENQLTGLDLSANSALTTLYCDENQLTSLDISANSTLTVISCENNQLTSLNVQNGNNYSMGNFNFYATGNPELSCIQVDDEAYATATWFNIDSAASFSQDCFAAPIVYIPDPNFKATLIGNSNINTNGDAEIQVTEAEIYNGVLNISFSPISDLTGIASFVALTELICYNNQLTSLDLSTNSALTILHCYNNQLTSLDISANSALTELYCYNNQLTNLDISANSALTEFSCENNQLTSLDISANSALTFLSCADNQLTSLDLSVNSALTVLFCENNQLTGLDLSANTALTTLYCDEDQLTSLDLSANSALTVISCENNQLSSLNVQNGNNYSIGNFYATGNPELSCIQVDDEAYAAASWFNIDSAASFSQDCFAAPIVYIPDPNFKATLVGNSNINTNGDTEIQVAEAEAFDGTMNVAFNQISDLTGIASFVNLTELYCHGNQLTSLDLSANLAMTSLTCSNNPLTSLDLSANSALILLSCASNQLTSLDLSAKFSFGCFSLPFESINQS